MAQEKKGWRRQALIFVKAVALSHHWFRQFFTYNRIIALTYYALR
jgi:hypothetical protein